MSSLSSQRDIVNAYKKETCLVVSLLSRSYPMSGDLSRQIFKEEALEKPTQHVFINLSFYLVSIIDPQKAAGFTWPLYDSKSEKTYRTEFSNFLTHYHKLGIISPVLSSYFVNPGCFKVTKLMFQLAQLAMKCALESKMKKESHKKLYLEANEKLQSGNAEFLEFIEEQKAPMMNKFVVYQQKKQALLKISELMKRKILDNEEKIAAIKKKGLLIDLIENFIAKHKYDEKTNFELLKMKSIHESVPIFDVWREHIDTELLSTEKSWNTNMGPFLEIAKDCHDATKSLMHRHLGETDKTSYMVEYNHDIDHIDTTELETNVNSEQRYVLKNICKAERLFFPNLVRAFVIAICYIMKNVNLDDDIYKLNEYLVSENRNYIELVSAMRILNERVTIADTKLSLQSPVSSFDHNLSIKELCVIPSLPDLSDLKFCWESPHGHMDTFTPLNTVKHHFNLRRKNSVPTFAKPHTRSLITPFHQPLRPDFLSSLISSRFTNDRPKMNMSQNISMISQGTSRGNETIAECSSGFTKQQIQRLLSTKKTSSSKKHKFNSQRPDKVNLKKGGLFNESVETSGLFRSYSSPNLIENKRSFSRNRTRKLSVMAENSPSLLEVSGITALDINSVCGTPISVKSDSCKKKPNLPTITISPVEALEKKFNHILKETEDLNLDNIIDTPPLLDLSGFDSPEMLIMNKENTPQNKPCNKRTSSIEKLINRFKKVRASVLPMSNGDST